VPSADSVRVDRVGTAMSRVTSYSAGTEHTARADHVDFSIDNVDRHRQTWTNSTPKFPMGKPPLPPLSRGFNFSDTSSPQQVLSKKEEDLSEEWLVNSIWSY